jgi:hypothetical protein
MQSCQFFYAVQSLQHGIFRSPYANLKIFLAISVKIPILAPVENYLAGMDIKSLK